MKIKVDKGNLTEEEVYVLLDMYEMNFDVHQALKVINKLEQAILDACSKETQQIRQFFNLAQQ